MFEIVSDEGSRVFSVKPLSYSLYDATHRFCIPYGGMLTVMAMILVNSNSR